MKRVILLGSTGSIGRNVITVIENLKGFKIVGIAAYTNYRMLIKQARSLNPRTVAVVDRRHYRDLKKGLGRIRVVCGEEGITDMVESTDADVIVCAFASSVGVFGIIKAIKRKMSVYLATKEILVSFGDIIMKLAKKHGTELIPIDSEHSAIYQCLEGARREDVKRILLTASGGPFLDKPINNVRKCDVLRHPVWKMGAKITVDSATMMNKGLEVIEAHHLFNFPPEMIEVVIHPEAICHSLVQFVDGTLLAQLSTPDMKLPIQYALTAPGRLPSLVRPIDIARVKKLTFLPPDFKKFPCLRLAYEALNIGMSMPAVLNAANAEAVKLFLEDRLKFAEIPKVIRKVMHKHHAKKGNIQSYIEAEQWARQMARSRAC
jgi:1-deoxy-D-xylulose-5-phosphate reductoisomerase